MATFNLRCPKNYPRRCNLLETEKENLERSEKYSAFLMYQFAGQDDYLVDTIKEYFHSPTYHIFDAAEEAGLGIKICKICRLAQASDFGIVILTPENLNVFLEAGMMMGMGKRNLYIASRNILKAQKKTLKDVAFDLSDQLVIEHGDKKKLLQKLEKEVPPFIDNVIIGTAFERELRRYWQSIYNSIPVEQKAVLELLVILGEWQHNPYLLSKLLQIHLPRKAKNINLDIETFKTIYTKMLSNDDRRVIFLIDNIGSPNAKAKINPSARPYLEKFIFEEE